MDKVSITIAKVSKLTQLLETLNSGLDEKYPDFYTVLERDEDIGPPLTVERFNESFLTEIHNILDIYYFCGSSAYESLETLGLRSVGMFLKQLIVSSRKSMLCALKILTAQFGIPKLVHEDRFRVSTLEVSRDLIDCAIKTRFNHNEVRIQRGVVDRDLLQLIKKDFEDSPEMVPENVKRSLGYIYDEERKIFRDSREILDDILLRREKFMSLEPSMCKDTVAETMANIQSTTHALIEEQDFDITQYNEKKFQRYTTEFILNEFTKEIKINIEERTRTRMLAVIASVTNQIRKPPTSVGIVQTEVGMKELTQEVERLEGIAESLKNLLDIAQANVIEQEMKVAASKLSTEQVENDNAQLIAENALLEAEIAVRQFAYEPTDQKNRVRMEKIRQNLNSAAEKITKLLQSRSVETQFLGLGIGSAVFQSEELNPTNSLNSRSSGEKFMKFIKKSKKPAGIESLSLSNPTTPHSQKFIPSSIDTHDFKRPSAISAAADDDNLDQQNAAIATNNNDHLNQQQNHHLLELFNQLEYEEDRVFVQVFIRNLIGRHRNEFPGNQTNGVADDKTTTIGNSRQYNEYHSFSAATNAAAGIDDTRVGVQPAGKRQSILEMAFNFAIRESGFSFLPDIVSKQSAQPEHQAPTRDNQNANDNNNNNNGKVNSIPSLPAINEVQLLPSELGQSQSVQPRRTRQRKSVSMSNLRSLGLLSSLKKDKEEMRQNCVAVSQFSPWESHENEDSSLMQVPDLYAGLRRSMQRRIMKGNYQIVDGQSNQRNHSGSRSSIDESSSLPYLMTQAGVIESKKLDGSMLLRKKLNSNNSLIVGSSVISLGQPYGLRASQKMSARKLSSLDQNEFTEEVIQAIYLHVASNHSLTAECVALLATEGAPKQDLERFAKQVKYPFRQVTDFAVDSTSNINNNNSNGNGIYQSNLDNFTSILRSLPQTSVPKVIKFYQGILI